MHRGVASRALERDRECLEWANLGLPDTRLGAAGMGVLSRHSDNSSRTPKLGLDRPALSLQFHLLGDRQRVINLDAEITHCTLQLAVPEQ